MTLGFAVAAWPNGEESIVGVAADTRLSANGEVLTDAGVKIRKAEAALRRAEFLLAKADLTAAKPVVLQALELGKVAAEQGRRMGRDVTVKSSDGGLQSREAFEARVLAAAERVLDLLTRLKAAIDAKKAASPK